MSSNAILADLFSKSFEKPSDLLCCAFGLRNTEIDVYFSLISGPKTVKEIATRIDRDRSTVQRVLASLKDKGLVEMDEQTFERGGYYYVYRAISTETVRGEILARLDRWYNETRRFLLEPWADPLT
ncbi:MAG: helix-turn-helix domain-containing protein [Candidatus Thorarchaeota archaeon]